MDMELELNTVFKATDNLSLTTKIMGLSGKKWGEADEMGGNDLDIDHVYMTIKSGIGTFDIGRMAAGTFGTSFMNNEYEADRIKYTKVIDDLKLLAIFQKNSEGDAGLTNSDTDRDVYWLAAIYKREDIAAGVLYGFDNNKTLSDKAPPLADNETYKGHVLDPYITAKFGPLALQGELVYIFGDTEYDDGTADLDRKELAYNIEANYDLGMASVQAGYAFFSGDVTADNDDKAFSGWGGDRQWEKLFILYTDENGYLSDDLGESALVAAGQPAGSGGNLSQYPAQGAKIFYAGASVTPMENLKLGLIVGIADADKVDAGVEDDYGVEYDLTLNWKIYDNLTYSAIAAYLDAGDIWQAGDTTVDVKNTYALFHELKLTF